MRVNREELVEMAKRARENAYAPYSNFRVGAVILTESGEIYTGCNIENSSYGLSICAERVALFKAVSEGHRRFKAVAVVADTEEPVRPCGACRQVLWEFGDMEVIMANLKGDVEVARLSELLPEAFRFGGEGT